MCAVHWSRERGEGWQTGRRMSVCPSSVGASFTPLFFYPRVRPIFYIIHSLIARSSVHPYPPFSLPFLCVSMHHPFPLAPTPTHPSVLHLSTSHPSPFASVITTLLSIHCSSSYATTYATIILSCSLSLSPPPLPVQCASAFILE